MLGCHDHCMEIWHCDSAWKSIALFVLQVVCQLWTHFLPCIQSNADCLEDITSMNSATSIHVRTSLQRMSSLVSRLSQVNDTLHQAGLTIQKRAAVRPLGILVTFTITAEKPNKRS